MLIHANDVVGATRGQLNRNQIQDFNRDGFLILPGFVNPESCDALQKRALELVRQCDPSEYSSVFSSYIARQGQAVTDYIRGSADSIRFFFECNAFDETGKLKYPKELSLCKIGHGIHDCDAVFDEFSRTPDLAQLAENIGFRTPLLAQSMYLFKQPGVGAQIDCHQDASFIYTEPTSVTGLWIAIEEATIKNGCMWALPGAHTAGLKSRFVRTDSGEKFVHYDQTPFSINEFVPLEAKKGTLIVLHGLLPHFSKANHSKKSRHAYTLHLIEGDYSYPADNWLQRPSLNPFRGFR